MHRFGILTVSSKARVLAAGSERAQALMRCHFDVTRFQRFGNAHAGFIDMIRKLKSGEFRLYSSKKDSKTGRRRNLGTFATRAGAEKHERAVQYFKRGH